MPDLKVEAAAWALIHEILTRPNVHPAINAKSSALEAALLVRHSETSKIMTGVGSDGST